MKQITPRIVQDMTELLPQEWEYFRNNCKNRSGRYSIIPMVGPKAELHADDGRVLRKMHVAHTIAHYKKVENAPDGFIKWIKNGCRKEGFTRVHKVIIKPEPLPYRSARNVF